MEDCAEIGVKGISFMSDGESPISPVFLDAIKKGNELGISLGLSSNGFVLTKSRAEQILPYLTWLKVNFQQERKALFSDHGCKKNAFDRVTKNIADMVAIKKQIILM